MKVSTDEVLSALAITESDFRTTGSLARQLAVAENELEEILFHNSAIRRPILAREEENTYHRLVNRGLTRREKYRYFLAVISRQVR